MSRSRRKNFCEEVEQAE